MASAGWGMAKGEELSTSPIAASSCRMQCTSINNHDKYIITLCFWWNSAPDHSTPLTLFYKTGLECTLSSNVGYLTPNIKINVLVLYLALKLISGEAWAKILTFQISILRERERIWYGNGKSTLRQLAYLRFPSWWRHDSTICRRTNPCFHGNRATPLSPSAADAWSDFCVSLSRLQHQTLQGSLTENITIF